jgi:flagellar protein FliO/FliZ
MVWLSGIKMLASLLLVLALILLCYGAARRWLKWLPKNSQGRIQLQEMRALGPRKSLCLVQVDGRQLLLALQPERIELLLELSSAESGFATTLRQEQSRLRAEEGEDL